MNRLMNTPDNVSGEKALPMVPIFYTHNTFAEGGRKIHILNRPAGKCLCGYHPGLFHEIDISFFCDSVLNYVSQPDPDGNLCRRCVNIVRKRLADTSE